MNIGSKVKGKGNKYVLFKDETLTISGMGGYLLRFEEHEGSYHRSDFEELSSKQEVTEIKTLQDIKDEVYQEVGYKGGEITGDEVDMIAKRYATEAVKAFAKHLSNYESFHVTPQDGDTIRVIQDDSIEGLLKEIQLP
jgi:hypothetical protein